jgi:CheY-like chemotaxis protein
MEETDIKILIAEDDDGHASLIMRNLQRSGIDHDINRFRNGQEVIDYLYGKNEPECEDEQALLLLLDIRMPVMDGIEVLKKIKADKELKKMPVIMVTTTDDPGEVTLCHKLGCSNYVTKSTDYKEFISAIRMLGLFLTVVSVPKIKIGSSGR